ncbi:DUF4268 domain-containing protein, partial [Rhodosalinus sp. FB01]|uniref:DUF4268 domain-containing protein n=1 Tax=Rhodosalinus sp. FB01 TaxID=3239194 RepID=UPI003524B392
QHSSIIRGVGFNYSVPKEGAQAEVYIDRGKDMNDENLQIFDQLYANKEAIEEAYGGSLTWERLEGKRACRISAKVGGGFRDPETTWAATHQRMTDAMNRLVDAVRPHLRAVRIRDGVAELGRYPSEALG